MIRRRKKPKIQTLIFDRKYFKRKNDVKSWVRSNGFKILRYKKHPIAKYKNTFRVRQREPYRFDKKTFRTRVLKRRGVKAVFGFLK